MAGIAELLGLLSRLSSQPPSAPIADKWDQFPSSPNIDDRTNQIPSMSVGQSLFNLLLPGALPDFRKIFRDTDPFWVPTEKRQPPNPLVVPPSEGWRPAPQPPTETNPMSVAAGYNDIGRFPFVQGWGWVPRP